MYPEITPLDEHLQCFHIKSFSAWNTFLLFSTALLEKQERVTKRQTVPFAAYPGNGTSVMRGNCLYLVSGFISVEYQELSLLQLRKAECSAGMKTI